MLLGGRCHSSGNTVTFYLRNGYSQCTQFLYRVHELAITFYPAVLEFEGMDVVVLAISLLLRLDQSLLDSDAGRLLLRLVRWGDQQGGGQHYELMISTIYLVWGAFLWRAASQPFRHRLFIDFTVAADAAHFGLMLLQGLLMPGEHIHLAGDVLLGWASLPLPSSP